MFVDIHRSVMSPVPVLTPQDLYDLTASISQPGIPGIPHPILCAMDKVLQRTVGHRLFSVLRYDLQAGVAHRLYSSKPDIYPDTGSKTIATAPAMRDMVRHGRPLLTPDADTVRQRFADADTLFAMGCESVLNIPVHGHGKLLGQLNLLHRGNHFHAAHVPFCVGLSTLTVSALAQNTAAATD